MKKALITGITGQDGSYLADLLLEKGYEIWGLVRRTSVFNRGRIEHLYLDKQNKNFKMVYGDLSDASSLAGMISELEPDEVYNLGAQSHVGISFATPEYTADIDATGVARLLESIRKSKKDIKFYQASSSELYGLVQEPVQNEKTPFYPRSPYACAKAYAFYLTRNYREAYNMFCSNGILFNHESPRRGENFVTRKITLGLAKILKGKQKQIVLGNLNAKRDWGYAPDYVKGMWMILQHEKPDDFVLATGEAHSVREFVELAAQYIGIDIVWEGSGVDEKGINKKTGQVIVTVSDTYFRPAEVSFLLGDAGKAKKILGWEPEHSFEQLVEIMVKSDLEYIDKYHYMFD